MSEYYIGEESNRLGPYPKKELVNKSISRETLIWREGLDDWVEAGSLDELKFLFTQVPPPIVNKKANQIYSDPEDSREYIEQAPSFFSFEGRITRRRWSLYFLIYFMIYLGQGIAAAISVDANMYWSMVVLTSTVIMWMQNAKRFHDANLSGWWQLVPFSILILFFLPPRDIENRFGRSPRD